MAEVGACCDTDTNNDIEGGLTVSTTVQLQADRYGRSILGVIAIARNIVILIYLSWQVTHYLGPSLRAVQTYFLTTQASLRFCQAC